MHAASIQASLNVAGFHYGGIAFDGTYLDAIGQRARALLSKFGGLNSQSAAELHFVDIGIKEQELAIALLEQLQAMMVAVVIMVTAEHDDRISALGLVDDKVVPGTPDEQCHEQDCRQSQNRGTFVEQGGVLSGRGLLTPPVIL